MKRKAIFFAALLIGTFAGAQTYSGSRAFDGEHRNVIDGTALAGFNVVTGWFVGESAAYTRHLTDRWSVSAGEQVQFFKQLYSVDVMGTYRLPLGKTNLYFDGRVLFNRYDRWNVNEPIVNLSAYWETDYVDLRLGESLVSYYKLGVKEEYLSYTTSGYTEPLVMTFGLGVNIRPRSNPWNLGLFFRNYDQFYYENWNINWGVRFHAALRPRMRLYGEFDVRPAGSMSQLATRYETSLKVGLHYVL
ncbi:MAG: hypothetical protein IKG84_01115 [Bacteroidales bacterium]|nr:hypothetical protein [Bacteroidales bacterium]